LSQAHGGFGRRAWTRVAASLFLMATLLLGSAVAVVAQLKPKSLERIEPVEIQATPLDHFDKAKPDRVRFGRLEWRGGLVLTSKSEHFGGLSGLVMDADGSNLLAISDAGTWMTADVAYTSGVPSGLKNAKVGPILGRDNRRMKRNAERDAEGVTLAGGSLAKGSVLLSFERNHRIGRFPFDGRRLGAPTSFLKMPPDTKQMDPNQGLESVAVLQGGPLKGSTIAFAERLHDPRGHHTGWIWVNGEPRKLHLTDGAGFDITDAVGLPDGDVLILERRFRWTEGVKMRLRLLESLDIASGAVMEGETLLEADMGFEIDNMEGVAVHRGPRGETIVTLISDDNFNHLLQRTLLLQFRLHEKAETARAEPQQGARN
jgi:hypothetical protein